MPRYTVHGIQFNVSDYGSFGADLPLLLLHGFMGSADSWPTHTPALSARSRRILALDLLGHGLTDSPADPARYSMPHCSADIAALLDQLGLKRVTVLGYSMGGRAALHFALTNPQRVAALILESASPGLAELSDRQARVASDEALAQSLERNGLLAFVDQWERLPLFASQARLPVETQNTIRQGRLANNAQGLANSLRGLGTGTQPSLWDRLNELQAPTLLIAGALDDKFTRIAEQMAAKIPAAQLESVAEAGHTVHLEQPAVFDHMVLDFLLASKENHLRNSQERSR